MPLGMGRTLPLTICITRYLKHFVPVDCLVGGAFPGIDIGLSSMRKGEMARFLFEKEYVFKDMGCGPRVPPGTGKW